MKYLHRVLKLSKGKHIKVHFSEPSKVLILTDFNYNKYKNHITYSYWGGAMKQSPFEFATPDQGTWHVVVEKGGYFNPSNVVARVEVH